MKKIILCLMIFFSCSTIAYAQGELPELSGRYYWTQAWIEILPVQEGDTVIWQPTYCGAVNEDGESIGNNTSLDPITIKSIKVVINENKVKAICKFTDESGWYGTSAQLGEVVNCSLVSEDGTWFNGIGHITAAANHGDEPGGNVTLECTYDRYDCIYCDN